MICNVRGARCRWSRCDDASPQQEVASLDVLNRFDHNVERGMSAGLWRNLHRYVFQLVTVTFSQKGVE